MADNITTEQVNYTYDQLNRLAQSVSSVTGTMPFAYDGFGNLTQQGQTTLSIDATTNRTNSAGYQYNANGNVTQTPGPATYSYDVANRMVSNGAIYNPRNQRVFDGTYIYLYTPDGKLVGKYAPAWGQSASQAYIQGSQPNVYFAGKLIQEQGQWVMTDRLGSVRLHATSGRSNYQPYGAEVAPTSDQRTKFATYYRDSAGLDYAGQRYYGNAMGRFLTPDPYKANDDGSDDPADPGSWNRYTYAGGDPINYYDPTGLFIEAPHHDQGVGDGGDGGGQKGSMPINKEVPREPNPEGKGGGVGALTLFQRAANRIAKQKKFKPPCNNDFSALGTTAAAVQAGAANVDIEYGTGSAVLEASLYANTAAAASAAAQYGNLTVGQFQVQNPGTVAQAQLNGNTIYINPVLIMSNNYFQNLGTMLHELLHNVTGLTDDQIQTDLGLSTAQVSNNMTQKLIKDCF